ncbi:DUF309 domain-containing protein [Prochlorococcus sp. MIT 1341]|uniref:DUF309 domain-containing protein n=1 Tax=Prochlorococcus sp. MIT 1341 TaxID=3096221 RepID=UPI002A75FE58|nr:DUF309 domain-containing protein [Prochlorococcus sp. MIT 1341]
MPEDFDDSRLKEAVRLFNNAEWYRAHDALEEIWHETNGVERRTIQGFLQVAVAQLHLERGNRTGATILYGEGLGRLRALGTPDLGFDIETFCLCVQERLRLLQEQGNPDEYGLPVLDLRDD